MLSTHHSARRAQPSAAAAGTLMTLLCLAGVGAPAVAQETSPKGYIEMPESEDGSYVLTARTGSGRNWGTPVFVRYLVMVAREWKRRHPEGPILRIGDMSKPDGSNFPPHKTHKDGLTADLFTSPKNACHVNYPDQGITEELAQLMYDLGARQILYNGDRVVKAIPVAQKWPKHDDHFHIVIDPRRVPAAGALMVLPEPGSRSGDWIGKGDLDDESSGLVVRWRVLGEARYKGIRVQFDDLDPNNGILHDSDGDRIRQPAYKVPVRLEDGKTYRWRVVIETADQEQPLELPWQTLETDLQAPQVEALSPKDSVDYKPRLRWRYEKQGAAQARYWIDLDQDPDHRRISLELGPFEGSASSAELPDSVRFRRRRTYHWRVRVEDAHGNQATSEWTRFKTSRKYGKVERPAGGGEPEPSGSQGPTGTVSASALNMRKGPGTQHAVITTLKQGQRVRIVAERSGWLEIEVEVGGRSQRGFVSSSYIKR